MSLNEHSFYGSLRYTTGKVSQTASVIVIEHLTTHLHTALAEMTNVSVTRSHVFAERALKFGGYVSDQGKYVCARPLSSSSLF